MVVCSLIFSVFFVSFCGTAVLSSPPLLVVVTVIFVVPSGFYGFFSTKSGKKPLITDPLKLQCLKFWYVLFAAKTPYTKFILAALDFSEMKLSTKIHHYAFTFSQKNCMSSLFVHFRLPTSHPPQYLTVGRCSSHSSLNHLSLW